MIDLPEYLADRVRTAAATLLAVAQDVPGAPSTVYGIVTCSAGGAPEPPFPTDDAPFVAFLAGEIHGIAVGLDIELLELLAAVGIVELAPADDA